MPHRAPSRLARTRPSANVRCPALLVLVALLALCATGLRGRAGAAYPDHPGPAGGAAATRPSEDALLLEALRYLNLLPRQLRQLVFFARQADRRRAHLAHEEAAALARIERLSGKDPEAADRLGRERQQIREQVESEIVAFGTYQLVRIFTREQIALAWRLRRRHPPNYARADPALLDPDAGFVAGGPPEPADTFDLELHNPPAAPPGGGTEREGQGLERQRAEADVAARLLEQATIHSERLSLLQDGSIELLGEAQFVRGRPETHFPQRVIESDDLAELATAVEPLARRLFLSPRFVPVLQNALARGLGGSRLRPAAPTGLVRPIRDYRLYEGFRDQSRRGPPMEPFGGIVERGLYLFAPGQGLGLADTGVTDHYSVELVFRHFGAEGYQKLIDFKKRARDTGLYLYGGRLNFYNLALATTVRPGQEHRVRLERNRASRVVRAYLDGQPAFAFIDLDDEAAFEDHLGIFFVDDIATNGEQGRGACAAIRFWDRPSTPPAQREAAWPKDG